MFEVVVLRGMLRRLGDLDLAPKRWISDILLGSRCCLCTPMRPSGCDILADLHLGMWLVCEAAVNGKTMPQLSHQPRCKQRLLVAFWTQGSVKNGCVIEKEQVRSWRQRSRALQVRIRHAKRRSRIRQANNGATGSTANHDGMRPSPDLSAEGPDELSVPCSDGRNSSHPCAHSLCWV